MTNVIGYKGTAQERYENWHAMLIFRNGSKTLLANPDTKKIAIEDGERYTRFLNQYVMKEAA